MMSYRPAHGWRFVWSTAIAAITLTASETMAQSDCEGDATRDCTVDVEDLVVIVLQWGTPGPEGDVDGSGFVDVVDIVAALLNWGACTGECDPCSPDTELFEPETCGEDTTGGCNATPPDAFVEAASGQTWCGSAWAEGGFRDTDWYRFEHDGGVLTYTLTSLVPTMALVVVPCAVVQSPIAFSEDGASGSASVELEPGVYAIFVAIGNADGSGVFDGFPCAPGNSYQLSIGP